MRKLLIGIDGCEANIKNRVGVNVYAFELLWALYKLNARHRFRIYLKEEPLGDFPSEREGWEYKVIPGGRAWILTRLVPTLFLEREKPDVFFSPSHYVPPVSPQVKICSIMDLGYLKFSGQFKRYDFWQLTLWTAWSIIVSKGIITISESSRRDIVRHYPFAAKKVFVTPLAYDDKKFTVGKNEKDVRRIKKKYGISNDYVLFMSTLKPSKNVEGLVRAWKLVKKEYPGLQLIIAGKKGWLYESIFDRVKEEGLEDEIVFTGFVPEDDKPALISGARVFVLPSFWEGFGLDVLNAMASGVPVVVSNVASLPEVVGNAGVLVDPRDIEDIARGVLKVLKISSGRYNELVRKGVSQAAKFSWKITAQETLEVIENVVL